MKRFVLPRSCYHAISVRGCSVSAARTRPPADRVAALATYDPPRTAEGLRRFLGMMNFHRAFIPHAATAQAPLHDALADPPLKGTQLVPWTPELRAAFEECKQHLTRVTLCAHPVPGAELGLSVDASSIATGAALHQRVGTEWQPLAFFSKKLNPRQAQWPAHHRELLAAFLAVRHYMHILEAQACTIYTDHKPLIHAFSERRDTLAPVQLNHLTFISQFTTDVRHVSGSANTAADAFSRIEDILDAAPPPFPRDASEVCVITEAPTPEALAADQATDCELQQYLLPGSSLRLVPVPVPASEQPL